jgi:chromate transporter
MILLQLFLAFLKIGCCAIGGAYSFLPLLEKEMVQNRQWLGHDEFLQVVGMTEVFPGAISIKFATYMGYKMAGISGALVANLANLLPPALLMIAVTVACSRAKGIPRVKAALDMVRYAVAALLVAMAVRSVSPGHLIQPKILVVVVASFLLFVLLDLHPALIVLAAAAYGAMIAHP